MSSIDSTNSVCYDQIPEKLRALPNWVVWRYEKRLNSQGVVKITKVCYNARTGKRAKSNDPATWSTFAEAKAAYKGGGYDGIGICLSENLIAADLDGCLLADGSCESWAEEIVQELCSYTEKTPSGKGLRIFVYGELPDGRRQKEFGDREHHGLGLYDAARGRYLTVTGWRIGGNGTIAERTEQLRRIHARLFPPEPP